MFDLKALEFDKVCHRISQSAQTDQAKSLILTLPIMTDAQAIEDALIEVDEARWLESQNVRLDLGGFKDVTHIVRDIELQRLISPTHIRSVYQLLITTQRVKRQLESARVLYEKPMRLETYSHPLDSLIALRDFIAQRIDNQAEVKDESSVKLSQLRAAQIQLLKKIKQTLDQLMRSEASKLTESLYTIRHDRYVLPVKPSDKNSIKGAIVDYSASAETVYIEPAVMAELSAQKRRLEEEESAEIERILWEIMGEIHQHAHTIIQNQAILVTLDGIMAKGIYAFDTNAVKPSSDSDIHLVNARHPLIPPVDVVANTISLQAPHRMMIITGSNTGGKTVVLKTIGLSALMHQAGLLVLAEAGSCLPIFDSIRADIGDEQSIEQSLSTFSSHMSHLISIEKEAYSNALVLLDELGSGTDPQEGSALAMSLLDTFLTRDVRVFASTHYPQLKAYAYDKAGVMNASVAFDKQTLKPTYRLLMHTPGTSHAFLISERLGLPQGILNKAEEYYANEQSSSTSIIEKLHDESVRLDHLIQQNTHLNQMLTARNLELSEKLKALDAEKRQYQERMNREQDRYLKELRRDLESFIKELETKVDTQAQLPLLAQAKQGLQRMVPAPLVSEEESSPHTYKVNDRVLVLQYNREGTLIKSLKNDRWQVNLGALQMTLHESEFKFITAPAVKKQNIAQPMVTKSVSMELDLRGQRVDEAQANVEKYLDDCVVANVPFGSIIHGFGTLALRNMVKQLVKNHPLVKRSRDGQMNEGGQGVTIVYFSDEKVS